MRSVLKTVGFISRHPLASLRPAAALWRYGRWQVESRFRREVEFDWIGGAKLAARNGMTGATGNIYCGLHECADMAFLLHLLRPGDLFVDAGANIGSFTVLASAVCGARAVAIEPDPDTMRHLARNIAINDIGGSVTAVETALGEAAGLVRFTTGKDTMNRVAASGEAAREVRVMRLDDILAGKDPVLMKIDVEGYERRVLAGAARTLRNPSLLAIEIETVEPEVRALLEAAGLVQHWYDPFDRTLTPATGPRPGAAASNALFVRDAAACRARIVAAPLRNVLGVDI